MPLVSCPECRKDVSSKATACPHCGRPLTPIPEPKRCPFCREVTRTDATICPHCRRFIGSEAPVATILGALLLFAGIICFVYFLAFYEPSGSTILSRLNSAMHFEHNKHVGLVVAAGLTLAGLLIVSFANQKR
jgi:predicted amidophosphoribosyltransferase